MPGVEERDGQNGKILRRVWQVDEEIPVFTQNRGYVERFLSEAGTDAEKAETNEGATD